MFTNLTNYLLGSFGVQQADSSTTTTTTPRSTTAEGVGNNTRSQRLTAAVTEDEWVLVDRRDEDSEGNSEGSYSDMENLDPEVDDGLLVVERSPDRVVVVNTAHLPVPSALLTRTNSASMMEESWFLTPPPCFTSTGPVHMETSPLENLLIEHPSMSVYTRHASRRHQATRSPSVTSEEDEDQQVAEEVVQDVVLVHHIRDHIPRVNRGGQILQQQERQGIKSKRAQKVQIKNAGKTLQRGNLDRSNKAREVNSRNRRQRRGERSQGATRSHANNNRKC